MKTMTKAVCKNIVNTMILFSLGDMHDKYEPQYNEKENTQLK